MNICAGVFVDNFFFFLCIGWMCGCIQKWKQIFCVATVDLGVQMANQVIVCECEHMLS